MPVDFDELVLAPAFDTFAQPVTWLPAAGGVITSLHGPNKGRGVFDAGFSLLADMGGDVATSTRRPLLGVRLSEFATAPVQNDKVVIDKTGEVFIVKDPQPDSHGHSLLLLQSVCA